MEQYAGPVQILFGVATADDPVCNIVHGLLQEFPGSDAQLVVCGPPLGANAKVSQLVELERRAKYETLVISDADVRVPPDLLANIVVPLDAESAKTKPLSAPLSLPLSPPLSDQPTFDEGRDKGCDKGRGLVCCLYRLANPTTLAMQWEAIATNADFWSQVLQARSLKLIDFALGAVMTVRRQQLHEIGGLSTLVDFLADDYQLGSRLAHRGYQITISPVVIECWSAPSGWAAAWQRQLRWARTIRVCQPLPYFFSVLSNATLWPLLWLVVSPVVPVVVSVFICLVVRIVTAVHLQHRLSQNPNLGGRASSQAQTSPEYGARGDAHPPVAAPWRYAWLVPVKDLLQAVIWLLAFLGSRVEWHGQRLRLRRDGTLAKG